MTTKASNDLACTTDCVPQGGGAHMSGGVMWCRWECYTGTPYRLTDTLSVFIYERTLGNCTISSQYRLMWQQNKPHKTRRAAIHCAYILIDGDKANLPSNLPPEFSQNRTDIHWIQHKQTPILHSFIEFRKSNKIKWRINQGHFKVSFNICDMIVKWKDDHV